MAGKVLEGRGLEVRNAGWVACQAAESKELRLVAQLTRRGVRISQASKGRFDMVQEGSAWEVR